MSGPFIQKHLWTAIAISAWAVATDQRISCKDLQHLSTVSCLPGYTLKWARLIPAPFPYVGKPRTTQAEARRCHACWLLPNMAAAWSQSKPSAADSQGG